MRDRFNERYIAAIKADCMHECCLESGFVKLSKADTFIEYLSLIHIQMCIRDRYRRNCGGQITDEKTKNGLETSAEADHAGDVCVMCCEEKHFRFCQYAVSYTHLDVYKRQWQGEYNDQYQINGTGFLAAASGQFHTCLLYTSNTGNLELDMILNHKLAKAEAMSCQIQSQIVIPCQLPVDGYCLLYTSRIW